MTAPVALCPLGPNPSGLCMCGCGGCTRISKTNTRGRVVGQPVRFLPGHNSRARRDQIAAEKRGARNPNWGGSSISRTSLHDWLNQNYPKRGVCETCGQAGATDYANLTGNYTRDRADYAEMCRRCHMAYDYEHGFRGIERKTCKDCFRVYYSWGAHAEECPGPRQRIADPPPEPASCDCPAGAWHEEGCYLLTKGEPE